MIHTKDFSAKTIKQLTSKGISIIGTQAMPGFEGDIYFSGVSYKLQFENKMFLRNHSQVIVLAASSWSPETDL